MMTLEEVAEQLEAALATAEQDLAVQCEQDWKHFGWGPEPMSPYVRKDNNGRYILLDALAALAQVKAAL